MKRIPIGQIDLNKIDLSQRKPIELIDRLPYRRSKWIRDYERPLNPSDLFAVTSFAMGGVAGLSHWLLESAPFWITAGWMIIFIIYYKETMKWQ